VAHLLARLGLARIGLARIGLARIGLARLGLARLGLARLGLARIGLARIGLARIGLARIGLARLGLVRLGQHDRRSRVVPACRQTPIAATTITATTLGYCHCPTALFWDHSRHLKASKHGSNSS